jgi:ferric-dicitrate binding protein FerR (iron transport regulator)
MEELNDKREFYTELVQRYADNLLSEEELEVFFHALRAGLLDHSLVVAMTEAAAIPATDAATETLARETAEMPITTETVEIPLPGGLEPATPVRRLPRWTRIAAAAVIIAALAGGAWLWLNRSANNFNRVGETARQPIQPGGNHATLTLANGNQIILDSAANGLLSRQGNADVLKLHSGQLAYRSGGLSTALLYNTITTPRGGEYAVTLPDGSTVRLNAASSIRFPTTFSGKDREVSITGEAYFEIARDPAHPFRVRVGDSMAVDVLGTDFDIMAYGDEPAIRTTLLRGAVRVRQGPLALVLTPGEQAQVGPAGSLRLVRQCDTTAVVAWIGGFFQFRDLDLRQMMRQIQRWYNVQVVYDLPSGSPQPMAFGGRIARNLGLDNLILIMQKLGVHLRVDGDTIHVLP